ncbi:MAG TPA: aminotransferase, partial [Dehalococcoidia bacterium]|nr:aminotransferase [Dehalococcoidia bacterium]
MTGYKIPFSARSHQYTDDECKLVVDVMCNASPLTQGVYLDKFENEFGHYIGVEHAFAVTNATSALELAAQLCNFESSDEVIVPAHTFTSSAYPFAKNGANIVWADIELSSRVVGVEQIQKCTTSRTKAVVVPHLYGYLADMPEIMEFAKKN